MRLSELFGHQSMSEEEGDAAGRWLVLVFQFPKGRDSRRVKVWRRLQAVGAVALKKSAYLLPANEQSHEDFAWLLQELHRSGAESALLEAQFLDGMTDHQVRALFNAARTADFEELTAELETVEATLADPDESESAQLIDAARQSLARARKRLSEIEGIDFFGAEGHNATEAVIRRLREKTSGNKEKPKMQTAKFAPESNLSELRGRTWVTRRGVHVDRIASAWLIQRRIDPDAKFKFVTGKDYQRKSNEIRFDMFEAEYTHRGDLCTFEVLARLVDENDAALASIGEIVHDIDLKDGKFARPETAGVANLLSGIAARIDDDEKRIERGGEMFDDLYRFFSETEK